MYHPCSSSKSNSMNMKSIGTMKSILAVHCAARSSTRPAWQVREEAALASACARFKSSSIHSILNPTRFPGGSLLPYACSQCLAVTGAFADVSTLHVPYLA